MKDRIEKNRHHLATGISLVIGLAAMAVILLVWPSARTILISSLPAFLVVLSIRTAMIEFGPRRRPTIREKKLEDGVRAKMSRHLGIRIDANSGKQQANKFAGANNEQR